MPVPEAPSKLRLSWGAIAPQAEQAMRGLEAYVAGSGLDPALLELVKVRVSQMNRCAFCLDMHTTVARSRGEKEERLYAVSAWAEALLYSEEERVALAWAEALTRIEEGVDDSLYEGVLDRFGPEKTVALTAAVIAINAWNRWSIALRPSLPGSFEVGPA